MGTLSEAYRDHPLNLNHIIPLDFDSTRTLPESHIWSQSGEFSSGGLSGDRNSIPVINLGDPNAAELIVEACQSWGAFQLTSHGIPSKLIEEVEFEARRLFALPAHQKLKALRSPGGATGYGVARITPFFSKYMWHEGFTIMGSPIDHAKQLWPHGYEPFCEIMGNYQKQMRNLADKLLRIILKTLNISEEEVSFLGSNKKEGTGEAPCTALQLNSYPSCPDPTRAMGLAPHTDTSLITILHQGKINGLQILKNGEKWVPVKPISGAVVVNVGDLLHILSNGGFPCVVHRAVVNRKRQRFSMAYFYSPPAEFNVTPFLCKSSSLNSNDIINPRYRSVTVKEYVGIKNKHLDKALSFIRI